MRRLTVMLLMLLTLSILSTAAVQSVEGSNQIVVPTDYSTIQEAVDQASPGDTVFVKKGTYQECVVINKSLTLIGENKAATILGGWQLNGTVVLVTHDDVTLSGFTIKSSCGYTFGTTKGIHLLGVQGCRVSGCVFSQIGKGIWLYCSSCNILEGNSVNGPPYYTWSGATLQYSSNNTIRGTSITVAEQGGIELFLDSNGNSIIGNYVQSKWMGIHVSSSDGNRIEDNSIQGYRFGVMQYSSSHSIIKNNSVVQSLTGIQINDASNYNLIAKNNITKGNYCGVELHSNSSHNKLLGNNIADNTHGLEIESCINNTVRYNNITGSSKIGLLLRQASENLIQNNNFLRNYQQVSNTESNSTWDADGEGNYWDTFNATETSQYVIDDFNVDHYPLAEPVNPSGMEIEIASTPFASSTTKLSDYLVPVAVVSAATVCVVAAVGAIFYFRKQKLVRSETDMH